MKVSKVHNEKGAHLEFTIPKVRQNAHVQLGPHNIFRACPHQGD